MKNNRDTVVDRFFKRSKIGNGGLEGLVAEVVAEGYDLEWVRKVERLIYLSEYKRFQSAPGAWLTERAFWLDRRYPVVNRWRDGG